MIRKIISVLLISTTIFLICCGCWDYSDINKETIVISIGLDIVDDEYELTGEYALLSTSGSSESGSSSGSSKIGQLFGRGRDFEDARVQLDVGISAPVFLGATSIIMFGPNYAASGIEPYINRIDNLPDYKKTALVFISRETPKDIFKTGTKKDNGVGLYLEKSISYLYNNKEALHQDVGKVLTDIRLKLGFLLPYVGIVDGDVNLLGYAVMKDAKMIATIDHDNTDGFVYLLVKGAKVHEVIDVVNYETGAIEKNAFKNALKSKDISFEYAQDKLKIFVEMKIDSIYEYQHHSHYVDDTILNEYSQALSAQIAKKIKDIITKSQIEYQTDMLNIAKEFKAKYAKEYKNMDWLEVYKNAEVEVNVECRVLCRDMTDTEAKDPS